MADAPSLRNPNLKTARAKEHLETLKREIEAFQKTKPYTGVHEHYPERKKYIIRYTLQPVPPTMGLLVGEFAYCLRSALDQLVWQLGLLTTPSPSERSQFPIFEVNNPDTAAKFRRATNDVPAEAAAIIESFQPYHRGNTFKDDPLWRLNKLCIIDKHRLIPVRGTQADPAIEFSGTVLSKNVGLDNANIVLGTRSALPPKVNFDPHRPVKIIFGELANTGMELQMISLRQIYKTVERDVIPKFARFFP